MSLGEIEDRMQGALAMSHHIQMRILGAIVRGEVSGVVATDVGKMCDAIKDSFAACAGEAEHEAKEAGSDD